MNSSFVHDGLVYSIIGSTILHTVNRTVVCMLDETDIPHPERITWYKTSNGRFFRIKESQTVNRRRLLGSTLGGDVNTFHKVFTSEKECASDMIEHHVPADTIKRIFNLADA